MVDGAAVLMTMFHAFRAMGIWGDERGTNMLDTGAHFYDVYETSDGKYVSIGSIEPQFYAELLRAHRPGGRRVAAPPARPHPVAGAQGALRGAVQDQDPRRVVRADGRHRRVLRPGAVHDRGARRTPTTWPASTFVERDGIVQPAPAPRFGRTPGAIQRPPAHAGQHTDEVLADWGVRRRPGSPSCARPAPSRDLLALRVGEPGHEAAPLACGPWLPWSASTPIPTTSPSPRPAPWPRLRPPATAWCWCWPPGASWASRARRAGRRRGAVGSDA